MPEVIKISHAITIGDAKYGNAKPGVVEATLKPGETMEEGLDELDDRLNAWHRKKYPHLYEGERMEGGIPLPADYVTYSSVGIVNLQDEKIQIAIENASTMEELKKVKTDYPMMTVKLMALYNEKLKSFQP